MIPIQAGSTGRGGAVLLSKIIHHPNGDEELHTSQPSTASTGEHSHQDQTAALCRPCSQDPPPSGPGSTIVGKGPSAVLGIHCSNLSTIGC